MRIERLTILLLLWLSPLLSAWAQEPVGLVIDLAGRATISRQGKVAPLEALTYLEADSEIHLERGARLVLTIYAKQNEHSYLGPARLKITANEIGVMSGTPGKVRKLGEQNQHALEDGTMRRLLRPAGTVMRGGIKRNFSELPAAELAKIEAMRPGTRASVAEHIYFASALEAAGLHSEAQRIWSIVAKARPQASRFRALASTNKNRVSP